MISTLSILTIVSIALAAPVVKNTNTTSSVSWYNQNGVAGACGVHSQDSDLVVGLPTEFYPLTGTVSPYCGKSVVIKNLNNNQSVIAKVQDASGTKDLISVSVAVWKVIGGENTNKVSWAFTDANTTAEAVLSSPAPKAIEPSTTHVNPSTTNVAPTSTYIAPSSTYTSTYSAPSSTYSPYSSVYTSSTTTSEAPSSTSTAPKETFSSSSQQYASSGQYSGSATFYTQNGQAGACGNYNSDSAYIVAIDSAMYDGGSNCGRQLKITESSSGKSITASVQDECPSCNSATSLDLSLGAFNALSSPDVGLFAMTWSFV